MPFYLMLFMLLFSAGQSFGQQGYAFDKYPARLERGGISAKTLIYTKGASHFKTRISQAAQDTINFAGHCILLYWGCGVPCQQSAIIDTKTKKVIMGPVASTGFIYYPGSRLLIANPRDTAAPDYVLKKAKLYIWKDEGLVLLKTVDW